jgi:hypothetical protein
MRLILMVFLFIVVFVATSVVMGTMIYVLWNWLMPDIFGLKIISFWQALGLYYLSYALFQVKISYKNKQ